MPDLNSILAQLQQQRGLTTKQVAAIRDSFSRYNGAVSESVVKTAIEKLQTGLRDIVNEKSDAATVRSQLQSLFDRFAPAEIADTINLDFHVKTGTDVAAGAGNFLQGNLAGVVDEYPAWELLRFEARKVPRMWSGDEGTDDSSLMAGFESRWMQAAQTANDPDAARMLEEEGRMIALKSSDIWQALGDFDDGLGNPYPPFAFNSGMWTQDVSRKECEDLGLLDAGDEVAPMKFDFLKLFDFAA